MATFRKRENKWQVQIRRQGFPTISRSFLKRTDAAEWARHWETKADRNELPTNTKALASISLGELVQRYRDEISCTKRGSEIEIIVLDAFLRDPICRKKLSVLATSDFADYRDRRLAVISAKTLIRQLAPLSNMFNIARREWGLPLRSNPLSDLRLVSPDNKRKRRLQEGELDKLLEAGRKTRNPLLIPIVRLALETAMRRGEILALQFCDVDIERCTATIRESKNGYSRTIPLSSLAAAILESTLAVMCDKAKAQNARIFPLTPVAVRLAWDKLTKRAKIDDLHFHDLRHEAISRFFELGLTVPEVASISGHRDIRMLLRYAHADKGKLAKKLNASSLLNEAT